MVSGQVRGLRLPPTQMLRRRSKGGAQVTRKVFMRNVASPSVSVRAETEPQGEATDRRAWDLGEGECRAAIVRIRANARPEREQTSERSFVTRRSENGVETGIHRLEAALNVAGVSPGLRRRLMPPTDTYREGLRRLRRRRPGS